MNCNNCLLGAPYNICWQTQCINYKNKKYQEKEWSNLMIQINYNINMPKTCSECPLYDDEFFYCHGHIEYKAWEVEDMVLHDTDRPEWCPLIEVKNET